MRAFDVLEEFDLMTRSLNRDHWYTAKRRKAWKRPVSCQLRFHNIIPVINTKVNPSVPCAISACSPDNVSSVISKSQKLSPCPQSKIITISLPDALELFRRHPVVFNSELLLIGNVLAG